jgi:hypothetical protein
MKKMKILLVTIGMLLLSIFGITAQDTIFYYGWEEGTTPGPIGNLWNNTGVSWTHETVVGDPTNAHTGEGYFKAIVTSVPPNQWDNQGVVESVEVEDTSSYRFTIWAKATGGDNTKVNLTCGQYTTWAELTRKGGVLFTPEWKRYYLMVPIVDASQLQLHEVVTETDTVYYPNQIRFPVHYFNTGTYYVDDVSILKSTIAFAVAAGNTLTINFGYAIDWNDDIDKDAFTVTVNGSPVTVESAIMRDLGDLVEPWVDLTLNADIQKGDLVKVSHDGKSGLVYTSVSPVTDELGTVLAFTDEIAEYGVLESPVGIKDVFIQDANIVSNNDYLYILDAMNINNVTIYNLSGQIVKNINSSSNVIPISDLKQGAYIVKIKTSAGSLKGKFMK